MYLYSEHLIIRNFVSDDLNDLSLILKNEEVMRFSLAGALSFDQSRNCLQRIMDHYVKHGFGLYALIHKQDNRLIGMAGFMIQSLEGEDFIELGYRLDPEYWRKGLASEACSAILKYGFSELNLDRVISIIDPKNIRSIKVASRIGMNYWKDSIFHEIPVMIYSIDKLTLSDFDFSWEKKYSEETKHLKNLFQNFKIDLFHIGSTSIPGCSAKPIIDILGVTSDILEVDHFNKSMIDIGFEPLGEYGMKQRRYFRKRATISVNLHIFEESDLEVKRLLRFCNYLRHNPNMIKEYSSLKQTLVKRFPHDIQEYTLGKEKFIKKIDILAANDASIEKEVEEPLKKTRWTQDEIKSAMQANMHLQMTYFAKYVPAVELLFEPDVTVVRSKICDDTFNYVLDAKFTESNAHNRIRHIKKLFQEHNLPFSWWTSESDSPSNLRDFLMDEGFSVKEKNIGMYMEIDNISMINNTSLLFKRADSPIYLKDFSLVIESIGGSQHSFDVIYSHLPQVVYAGKSSIEFYVAYFENKPIVTGILVTYANVAGIYYVATTPDFRKKGFGTAMMQHLLQKAKQKGYYIATLQASNEGFRLYERLGFKKCCEFVEFTITNSC